MNRSAAGTMRALVVQDAVPGRVGLQDVPVPTPGRGEVVVDVRAISLNRGEMRALRTASPGLVPGWDIAGVVCEDVDETLRAGTRVVGIAERILGRAGCRATRLAGSAPGRMSTSPSRQPCRLPP
jgi:NADPH:quinone reductase-like Zn-dependent oxidoreductase